MQFLLIISHDDKFRPTDQLLAEIGQWTRETRLAGVLAGGNPLRPAAEAKTIRVRNGDAEVVDGPFSSSREQMCGYVLVNCDSFEEAIELATNHPMAKVATIELRPVWTELAGPT
jgi:hypothetical protein